MKNFITIKDCPYFFDLLVALNFGGTSSFLFFLSVGATEFWTEIISYMSILAV